MSERGSLVEILDQKVYTEIINFLSCSILKKKGNNLSALQNAKNELELYPFAEQIRYYYNTCIREIPDSDISEVDIPDDQVDLIKLNVKKAILDAFQNSYPAGSINASVNLVSSAKTNQKGKLVGIEYAYKGLRKKPKIFKQDEDYALIERNPKKEITIIPKCAEGKPEVEIVSDKILKPKCVLTEEDFIKGTK